MVGYRRQKAFFIAVSVVVGFLIILYSLRKPSDAFKPFTAFIFASTRNVGLPSSDKDKQLPHEAYDNSVQFDQVSTIKELFQVFWQIILRFICAYLYTTVGSIDMYVDLVVI